MAAVTIRWDQRVLGRQPGDVETVELTDFIQAILDQGRASVVEVTQDTPEQAVAAAPALLGVFTDEAPAPATAEAVDESTGDQSSSS